MIGKLAPLASYIADEAVQSYQATTWLLKLTKPVKTFAVGDVLIAIGQRLS